ncbi:hypothetical protein [Phycisphaera mikurensis]|uniref:PEP-CTERM protein-sorting domain-containing protein n=1 Tax=Phycisphaera mikurensis (strain NBRC 102666 / KCTC 22515 / FYK2301M01) TaxID=1142394 RepID=I0IHN0_PHYMF|nr:hypothetical protein [Phycisphaera mikurensis]MBB6441013.1 hypothetical protein [Phycisphaera mikurensis]BAM04768.1 hypothetical protein PSMK_26090 [Phycisphaera mikurensis NBRC 102666]
MIAPNPTAPGRCALALATSALLVGPASASVAPGWDRPTTPADAAAAGTSYTAWDVFTGTTELAPDVAEVNAAGSARLSETTGEAFATGSGNIYSFSAATAFDIALPATATPGGVTDFQLQLRTLGTALDLGSVMLDGVAASSLAGFSYAETGRLPLGGFGGDRVDHLFRFTGPAGGDATLRFAAAGSSMSLDRVWIDTRVRAVPEPGPAALALAGVGLLARRRGA